MRIRSTQLFPTLALVCALPVQANILAVDINDIANNTAGNTQTDFDALTRDSGGAGLMVDTFNGITVDVDPFGLSFGDFDRKRATPVDGGALTESSVYQDFVFAEAGAAGTKGYDVSISGLNPNTWYRTEVWSFDPLSPNNRVSDWSTTGGNGTLLVADNYDFNGNVLPTTNTEGKFNFWVKTDGSGDFSLSGRNVNTGTPGVFLNGLAITHQAVGNKVYRIDIDSTETAGGSVDTMPGWTSLDASGSDANAATVTVDGITFQPFSADATGSRIRRTGDNTTPADPNPLNGDFVFDDGSGQAVGLFLGDAGDLEAGTWLVEMYIWDNDGPGLPDDLIVGLRRNTSETIISTGVRAVEDGAAITFEFESDGIGQYDVFVRDAAGGTVDRSRLNAVTLALIPEPSSLALLGLGGLLVARRRR